MTEQSIAKNTKEPSIFKNILLWSVVVAFSLLAYGVGMKLGRDYKIKREKILIVP